MRQVITLQTAILPPDTFSGWILYTIGDSSWNPHYIRLYETACAKRGMTICQGLYDPRLLSDQEAIRRLENLLLTKRPQFVINRTRDFRLAQLLESEGIHVFNNAQLCRLGNDKALAYEYMQRRKIPVMPTICGLQTPPPWYPAVVKSRGGHGGTEVFYIRNAPAWREWNSQRRLQKDEQAQYIVQQAASELGRDVRVYVVGKEIRAAVLRVSDTDFRSNYCLGGSVRLYMLSSEERALVQQAVCGLSIGMAGIDFIFHQGQMIFNELEDMVGARGLYSLTDHDIVDDYVGFVCKVLANTDTKQHL